MAKSRGTKMTVPYALALLLGGVIFVIVGSALKSHFQLTAAVCNTYGGPAGQCTGNEAIFTLGQILQPVGAIMAVVGLIGLIVAMGGGSKGATAAKAPAPKVVYRTKPQRSGGGYSQLQGTPPRKASASPPREASSPDPSE
jgi:hypothetical protein